MKKADIWIVNSIKTRNSRHGGTIEEIVCVNFKTRTLVKTYLDPENRNYSNWNQVLEQRDQGCVITNVRITIRNGTQVINADSQPKIVWQGTKQELADCVAEEWQREKKTQFQELFD